MDQLIYAFLSHTHYWYEVAMLKVPAKTRVIYHYYYCLYVQSNFVFSIKTCDRIYIYITFYRLAQSTCFNRLFYVEQRRYPYTLHVIILSRILATTHLSTEAPRADVWQLKKTATRKARKPTNSWFSTHERKIRRSMPNLIQVHSSSQRKPKLDINRLQ